MKYIVLHYSKTKGGDVRFMRAIHLEKDWRDVGYHFVLPNGLPHGDWPAGIEGEVQDGRHLDDDSILEPDEFGAHALYFNRESVGICLIGDFQFVAPSQKQIAALIGLLARLCRQFDLDPMEAIVGHRDLCNTLCPGLYFYNLIPTLKWSVKKVNDYYALRN